MKTSRTTKWIFAKTAIAATATTPSSAVVGFVPRATSIAASSIYFASGIQPTQQHRSFTTSDSNTKARRSSLFESMRSGYYKNTNSDEISLEKLIQKASDILETSPVSLDKIWEHQSSLFFASSYDASTDERPGMKDRGFSNWIVPGRIMVGQYPGGVPENGTPSQEEIRAHLQRVLDAPQSSSSARVCFVSLQSELPPQDDHESWNRNEGKIYLDPTSRREWPNPFTHYAPLVDSIVASESSRTISVRYIHHPIEDLSVPSNSKNLRVLLWNILDFLQTDNTNDTSMVYIHCWGGRGRAGLTACCLLVLLSAASRRSTLGNSDSTGEHLASVETILKVVQSGYESRVGSEHMPMALSRSPQTESQRTFVRNFHREVTTHAINQYQQPENQ